MKVLLSKVWGGALALFAASAMVFPWPVAATTCSYTVAADPVTVAEGDDAVFRITVECDTSGWTWDKFRYAYGTVDDSAKSSDDYQGKTGAHVFTSGSSTTRSATVKTYDDDECESDEIFELKYELQGYTKAGWTDWPDGGSTGLPGSFSVKGKIEQAAC